MKPIPRALLIHSAALYNVTEGAWQDEQKTLLAQLTRVRVEPCARLVATADNRSVTLTATLFYDCRGSLPAGVVFTVGQRVEFGGAEYRVETVEPLYDRRKLHHIEVGLCP